MAPSNPESNITTDLDDEVFQVYTNDIQLTTALCNQSTMRKDTDCHRLIFIIRLAMGGKRGDRPHLS